MNGSGKVKSSHHREIVETELLAVTFVDLESHQAGADTVCRIGHRLAWKAKIATAVLAVPSFDAPITSSHKILLFAPESLPLCLPRPHLEGSTARSSLEPNIVRSPQLCRAV